MKTTADWKAQAKQIIRAELKRRDLSYADLAQLMEAIGLKVNDRTLANKITTGAFSAVFFLQVMEAIETKASNERREREASAAEFLQILYAEGPERARSDGIYSMIKFLFDLQEKAKFDHIDAIFRGAATEFLAPEYLIGLLRATYVERSMIPGWVQFLGRVEAEFGARGRSDIDELLQGLRPR